MTSPAKTFREIRPLPPATQGKPAAKAQETAPPPSPAGSKPAQPDEIGGPTGLEPTRYGDWERNGRCTDF
ncbi:MAG: DUF1674 domain-containing protein [Rhodospirillaceae bacterium]|nr:DUF1674 domain-containing protein [Rhodospirillaceae bacterium]